MKKLNKSVSVLMLLILLSCNGVKQLNMKDYLNYMEDADNGYVQTVETDKINYSIQFASPEYVLCKELSGQSTSNDSFAKARLNELEGYSFFLIKIELKDGYKSVLEKQQRDMDVSRMTAYYQNFALNDITVTADGAELVPQTYHFEDNYGVAPFNTIVVGYKHSLKDKAELTFNDKYNNIPLIKAAYSKELLTGMPKLKI